MCDLEMDKPGGPKSIFSVYLFNVTAKNESLLSEILLKFW